MAISKKRGIKSSAQDNFLEPNAVTSLSAVDVGTGRPYNDGAASLSWSLPAASPPATLYTITTTPASSTQTTTSTSYTFTGLASATSYTFTVVASNAAGSSPATTSSSVTITTVPQAPQSVTASASSANSNTVSWTLGANGGKALSSHNVYGSDGNNSLGLSGAATSASISDPGQPQQAVQLQ